MTKRPSKTVDVRESLVHEMKQMFGEQLVVVDENVDISTLQMHRLYYIEDPQDFKYADTLASTTRLSYPVVIARLANPEITKDLISSMSCARFVFEYKGYIMVVLQKSHVFTAHSLKTKFKVHTLLSIKGIE